MLDNKVVKCKRSECRLYFTLTEKDTKCPFCKTEYSEIKEKPKEMSAQGGRKLSVKTQKDSFKI